MHECLLESYHVDSNRYRLKLYYTSDYRRRDSEITEKDWVSGPYRLEAVTPAANPGSVRRMYVRSVRTSPRLAANRSVGRAGDGVWWDSAIWKRAPVRLKEHVEEAFPGASSRWVRMTRAEPPWLKAHMRPSTQTSPTQRHNPGSSNASPNSAFLRLPLELRQYVYRYAVDLDDVSRTIEKFNSGMVDSEDAYILHTPSLLLINRQVCSEAQEVFQRQQVLHLRTGIQRQTCIRWHITHFLSRVVLCSLQNVQLSYNIPPYGEKCHLQSFSNTVRGMVRIWKEYGHALKHLNIEIQSTHCLLEDHGQRCQLSFCLHVTIDLLRRCMELPGSHTLRIGEQFEKFWREHGNEYTFG